MAKFAEDSKWISINKSVAESPETIPSLAAVHALFGFDYVPMMFGVGKSLTNRQSFRDQH